jgi:hypothetical protein
MKNKRFKAVEFMRRRREELSKKYLENPKIVEKELSRISEKYGIKSGKQKKNFRRLVKKEKVF